jgi:hypothetical protein
LICLFFLLLFDWSFYIHFCLSSLFSEAFAWEEACSLLVSYTFGGVPWHSFLAPCGKDFCFCHPDLFRGHFLIRNAGVFEWVISFTYLLSCTSLLLCIYRHARGLVGIDTVLKLASYFTQNNCSFFYNQALILIISLSRLLLTYGNFSFGGLVVAF